MTKSSQLVDWVLAQTSNATLSQVVQFLRNYPDIPDFGSPCTLILNFTDTFSSKRNDTWPKSPTS